MKNCLVWDLKSNEEVLVFALRLAIGFESGREVRDLRDSRSAFGVVL